jgi:vacuolar-type H+-ATPase subunit E/Vma4
VTSAVDPLSPVRQALLAEARAQADALLAEADADVEEMVSAASTQAAEMRSQAREQGTADAGRYLAAERARSRREARQVVLQAQRRAWEELRRRCHEAVLILREDSSYQDRLADVVERSTQSHGPDVVVEERSDGVVLENSRRRTSYTLTDLAESALHRRGRDIEGLWEL